MRMHETFIIECSNTKSMRWKRDAELREALQKYLEKGSISETTTRMTMAGPDAAAAVRQIFDSGLLDINVLTQKHWPRRKLAKAIKVLCNALVPNASIEQSFGKILE